MHKEESTHASILCTNYTMLYQLLNNLKAPRQKTSAVHASSTPMQPGKRIQIILYKRRQEDGWGHGKPKNTTGASYQFLKIVASGHIFNAASLYPSLTFVSLPISSSTLKPLYACSSVIEGRSRSLSSARWFSSFIGGSRNHLILYADCRCGALSRWSCCQSRLSFIKSLTEVTNLPTVDNTSVTLDGRDSTESTVSDQWHLRQKGLKQLTCETEPNDLLMKNRIISIDCTGGH